MSTSTISKLVLTGSGLAVLLFVLLGNSPGNYAAQPKPGAPASTIQRMIVETGSVLMHVSVNRLNGIVVPGEMEGRVPAGPLENATSADHRSASQSSSLQTLHFVVGADSFFSIIVSNDLLRGPEQGSMALIPQGTLPALPVSLEASVKQLIVEKPSVTSEFNLVVRNAKTGFPFFNVEGGQFDYDAKGRSLSMTGGRLMVSKQFAEALGRPSDAGVTAGDISINALMQPVEIDHLDANGNLTSASLPALHQPGVGTVPGPDVIIGELIGLTQLTNGAVNGRVGISLGTDACNKGT
jgi:hypothetical protein